MSRARIALPGQPSPAHGRTTRLLLTASAALFGGACGVLWATPLANPDLVCPPPGEGRVQCALDKVWLTLGLHVIVCAVAATLLLRLALSARGLVRARREGTLVGRVVAPMAADPTLVAASWNHTYAVEGQTRLLNQSRLVWRHADENVPPADVAGLPLDEHGRLSDAALRQWLASAPPVGVR